MSKIQKIRALSADTLVYGLSSIVTRFISVFLVPIYTRIFDPADYGVINLVNTTFILIGIFVIVGLDNAAARWYWETESDSEKNITFSSWFWTELGISSLVGLLVTACSTQVSRLIVGSEEASVLFMIAAVNLPFTCLILVYTSWLRIKRKAVSAVVFALFNSILTIILSVALVVFLEQGLRGVFLAQLISNMVCAVPALIGIYPRIRFKYFRVARITEMLRYSVPLVPAAVAFWILNSAGAFFINHYSDKADVGLFQIGNSIAAVCAMVFWAFLQAWSPFAMSIHKQPDAKQTYVLVLDLYCSLGALMVLFIFLFAPEILSLIATNEYVPASLVAGILCVNILISNIAQITSIGSSIQKTNKPYFQGVLIGSMLSIGLYALLIPVLGKEGAALSSLAGSIFISVYVSYRSQLIYKIPYNFVKAIGVIGVLISCCLVSVVVKPEGLFYSLLLKVSLILLFCLFLVLINRKFVMRNIAKLVPVPAILASKE